MGDRYIDDLSCFSFYVVILSLFLQITIGQFLPFIS